jgi:transcriptional regulator with XRE-family HTH domain
VPTCGKAIKQARYLRGQSQAEIELITGVSILKQRGMERGSNPKLDDLLVVVSYLGIPLHQAVLHPRQGAFAQTGKLDQ